MRFTTINDPWDYSNKIIITEKTVYMYIAGFVCEPQFPQSISFFAQLICAYYICEVTYYQIT